MDDMQEIIERDFFEFCKHGALKIPNFFLVNEPHLKYLYTGTPYYNRIFRGDFSKWPENERSKKINEIVKKYIDWNSEIEWFTTPKDDHITGPLLLQCGFVKENALGMYLRLEDFVIKNECKDDALQILNLKEMEQTSKDLSYWFNKWALAVSWAFPWPEHQKIDYQKSFMNFEINNSNPWTHYIGVEEDEVKTATTVYYHNDPTICGLHLVGTIPSACGKGYATKLLNHILTVLKKNGTCKYVVLEADEPAIGIYKKLGFQTCFDFGVYIYNTES